MVLVYILSVTNTMPNTYREGPAIDEWGICFHKIVAAAVSGAWK